MLLPRLNGNGFSVESEQLIKANKLGLHIGKKRVSCKYKGLDCSTKTPSSHGFGVLKYVIWMIAERHPLMSFGLPGLASAIIGLLLGIYTLQYYNTTHIFLIPYAILVSIFLILGALGMFMGLMLNVLPNLIIRAQEETA
jgi:hypothetical protein